MFFFLCLHEEKKVSVSKKLRVLVLVLVLVLSDFVLQMQMPDYSVLDKGNTIL